MVASPMPLDEGERGALIGRSGLRIRHAIGKTTSDDPPRSAIAPTNKTPRTATID
jgi:hypothetical protein